MRRILNNSISLLVVIIVLFLVVPLPKQALDILIVLNIAISIMILMITMSISEALEFSIFPSLLLITTLFRLGLNAQFSCHFSQHGRSELNLLIAFR